jgi:two-component sensor histidine kinase/CheY-like chemotaxis protein
MMPNSGARILHIDDDEALGRLVARALGRRGYVVETCATAEEGLARIADSRFDVVVLDHYLTSGTGLGVIGQMAAMPEPPPVVYVTATADTGIAVEALKAGAADYVHKSVDEGFVTLLASAIDQAIEKGRLKREKERAEQEVRAARDRAELLLAEVNHRVANSLALVASLVRMQASAVADPRARDALAETQARISAIAGLHRKLYTSEDVRMVDLDSYLSSLMTELDMSMKAAGHRPKMRLQLSPFRLPTDRAVSVGLLVTELVTNAYKYAYADRDPGEVRLRLEAQDTNVALIAVEDDGVGWDGTGQPQGTGLGMRIVRAMAQNLNTDISYVQTAGTRAELLIRAELSLPG